MSDWRLRKIENRITKKTLIAKRNLHHDMTSKIILAFYFIFPFCAKNNNYIKVVILSSLK